MHPYVTAVSARLDAARAALQSAVEAVPPRVRRERPAAGRWCVNEVLEHLSMVEGTFTQRIAAAIDTARRAGLGPEHAPARTPLPANIEAIIADRVNRRTAPELVQPRGGVDASAAWERVERTRAVLHDTLRAADGLALSEVTQTHPFFGTLDTYQFAELIAAHEARHTEQIKEIAAQLAHA